MQLPPKPQSISEDAIFWQGKKWAEFDGQRVFFLVVQCCESGEIRTLEAVDATDFTSPRTFTGQSKDLTDAPWRESASVASIEFERIPVKGDVGAIDGQSFLVLSAQGATWHFVQDGESVAVLMSQDPGAISPARKAKAEQCRLRIPEWQAPVDVPF